MFDACLPLGPCVTSNETFWPSLRDLNPCMLIAEKCAKRSSPPPSGVMKPKPFESLNHLTVPVAICVPFLQEIKRGLAPDRCLISKPGKNEHQTKCRVDILKNLELNTLKRYTAFCECVKLNVTLGTHRITQRCA